VWMFYYDEKGRVCNQSENPRNGVGGGGEGHVSDTPPFGISCLLYLYSEEIIIYCLTARW
jgi:hypothetical protein